jgi:hypothetical protein
MWQLMVNARTTRRGISSSLINMVIFSLEKNTGGQRHYQFSRNTAIPVIIPQETVQKNYKFHSKLSNIFKFEQIILIPVHFIR